MSETSRTDRELTRILERLANLPEPPRCPECKGVVEAEWWNYCAMCGFHLAAHGAVQPQGNEGRK